MSDGSATSLLLVTLLLLITLAVLLLAAWRLRRHATQRAEAERRMGEALNELNALTDRLRQQQRALAELRAARDADVEPGDRGA
jgi:hypothetical protein